MRSLLQPPSDVLPRASLPLWPGTLLISPTQCRRRRESRAQGPDTLHGLRPPQRVSLLLPRRREATPCVSSALFSMRSLSFGEGAAPGSAVGSTGNSTQARPGFSRRGRLRHAAMQKQGANGASLPSTERATHAVQNASETLGHCAPSRCIARESERVALVRTRRADKKARRVCTATSLRQLCWQWQLTNLSAAKLLHCCRLFCTSRDRREQAREE